MSALYSVMLFAIAIATCDSMTINGRYGRGTPLEQIDLTKNINPDDFYNEMKYADTRTGYIESWPQSKEDAAPGLMQILEVAMHNDEAKSSLEDQSKSAEIPPEPLPMPLALNKEMKVPAYKKSGSNYYMSLCHFKICNMGRKRDTRYLHLNRLTGSLQQNKNTNEDTSNAM